MPSLTPQQIQGLRQAVLSNLRQQAATVEEIEETQETPRPVVKEGRWICIEGKITAYIEAVLIHYVILFVGRAHFRVKHRDLKGKFTYY